MKKIINHPEMVVGEMLQGLSLVHPDLAYDPEGEVIYRKNKKAKKVGIISGGGSGHEPAHAGYVGQGMLDAAVAGNVFASPSPDRIIKGLEHADSGQGVLMVIKNYSGDIMNFEMAGELAADMGISVAQVIVKDDVAVKDSTYSTGRRGIAGTVFVHKIAGAAAEEGMSLEDVRAVAQKTADNVRSFGISLSSCILPGVGAPGFTIAPDEMEVGMGIHGEPGIERAKLRESSVLAATMVEKICADLDYTNRDCAVMVNGLGGTPLMELYILARDVDALLKARGITPFRYYVGNFMTSLEMAGASLTLLRLDDDLKALLLKPCAAPAFPGA